MKFPQNTWTIKALYSGIKAHGTTLGCIGKKILVIKWKPQLHASYLTKLLNEDRGKHYRNSRWAIGITTKDSLILKVMRMR